MEEMLLGVGLWGPLALGLLLGLKHATDPDHIVAVSTLVQQDRNPWRGVWIGISWALGHSTPLLAIGAAILFFRMPFPEDYSILLEVGVGIMLVILGGQVFWGIVGSRLHLHHHEHAGEGHAHVHSHQESRLHERHHGLLAVGRPVFRIKSYIVGVVHGLAGTAAVVLLVLSSISSFWLGLGYLLLFGLGTIISMALMTLLMAVPLSAATSFQRVNVVILAITGTISIGIGLLLIFENTVGK